jgi:hypothetical protein
MSHSVEYYTANKNKLQDYLYKLSEDQLLEVFSIITTNVPNIQYSRNKNGYFLDIKQLPTEIIEKVD